MSDPRDHHHHHDDGHDHGHDHDHDHEHRPQPAPEAPRPDSVEDAGAEALSGALRSSFAIVKVLMVGLVVVFLFSGFFTVGTQEKAIILRFGKPAGDGRLLGPGPHWAFPPPIDEIVRIPVGERQSVNSTVGWYATTLAAEAAGNEPQPGDSLVPLRDGYAITADANIVHVRATLHYRIAEPGLRYRLDFVHASNAVQHAFDNSLLHAAAGSRVDDVTRGTAAFIETALRHLDRLIQRQDLGIVVETIDNVRIIPPRQLKPAFDRVLETQVITDRLLNDARSYANQVLSRAGAEAKGRRNISEAERTRLVEFVAAEVERFTNNLPAWRANQDLFVQRRQAEVFGIIFTNAQEKTVIPGRGPGSNRTLWLQLNREPAKPKVLEQPKEDRH